MIKPKISASRHSNGATIHPNSVHDTLRRSILVDGYDLVLDFEKSEGAHLHDARTNRRYLDLFSFYASLPLGFNHPRFQDPDFIDRLLRVSIIKPSNADIYSVEYADFVSTFHSLAIRKHFTKLFFISGGALAVENALKTAFDWKVRKNFARGSKTERGTQVIHFKQGFHGRSGYTLSITSTADPRKTEYFPKFNWPRILNPKCHFPLSGANLEKTERLERQALSEIEAAIHTHGDDIAAMIIEPIQGEGGDNHFRPSFLAELRRLCDAHELLLIFDEVQTGLGLTGTWWAFEQLGVKPDVIAFGKKTQVCGIAVTDRIDDVDNVFKVSSRINSTFGGDLTDMVRCAHYCRVIEEEQVLSQVQKNGAWMMTQLETLMDRNRSITNLRGRGLMIAFDLPSTEVRNRFLDACYDRGAIVLGCGERSVRLRPTLTITQNDLSRGLEIMESALQSL